MSKNTHGIIIDGFSVSSFFSSFRSVSSHSAKIASVLSILLLLFIAVSPMVFGDSNISDAEYKGSQHTVVYHKDFESYRSSSEGGEDTFTTNVFGSIVSTEYNPQVWEHGIKWNKITSYEPGKTLVFTGWKYAVFNGDGVTLSEVHHPGEVLTEKQIESATKDGKIHVFATWDYLNAYVLVDSDLQGLTNKFNGGTEYTNIVDLNKHTVTFNGSSTINGNATGGSAGTNSECTVRNGTLSLGNNDVSLVADLVIDSVTIRGYVSNENHGYDTSGIYANGHALVIGTGIKSEVTSKSTHKSFIQISGGSTGSYNTNPWAVDVYGEDDQVRVSSFVIIHSGTYSSIVGTNATQNNVSESVYLSLRDVTVLDTVVGGCAGRGSVGGSVYIFATGVNMPGDTYEEDAMESNSIPENVTLTESTILTGGSSRGGTVTDTHVYISGTSTVWDVQGGGRAAETKVVNSNVEVSGKALVKHTLCGSITDGAGNATSPTESVKNVSIKVTDSAMVASVFGAGYDTFYKATQPTMYNGGKISISVDGNSTVGDVYGGGYRGTIGTEANPIDSIAISISGGKILGSVYGGGSGGVDKICHNEDGTYNWSESVSDSTGYSRVYANAMSITVSGGSIGGNVYGGGKSVPALINNLPKAMYGNDKVAYTKCDSLDIIVTGGSVQGCIYGAGKGIDTDHFDSDKPGIAVMSANGEFTSIAWMVVDGYNFIPSYSKTQDYSEYAKVEFQSIDIHVSNASVGSDVYGGGAYSSAMNLNPDSSGISIVLQGGADVGGDVYGGGLGKAGMVSVGSDRTVTVNGASIGGSVYGGSCRGDDAVVSGGVVDTNSKNTSTILLVAGEVGGNVFGGGFYGTSYLNSVIKFGTPALKESGLNMPYLTDGFATLRVESIYGGGNIDLDSSAYTKVLLKGNSSIEIGSGSLGQFGGYSVDRIEISRDVFGAGNYSLIEGESSVSFDDYAQSSNMASVQRVDSMNAKNTKLGFSGSSDGGIQSLSHLYSLNRIITLNLDGGCVLTFEKEVSRISEYRSSINSVLAKDSDYSIGSSAGNKLVLLHGIMFYVMGDNDGRANDEGIIHGFTELSNGEGESYYGAFVQSSSQCDRSEAGFMIAVEGYMRQADMSVQSNYALWFITGHSSIDRTMTFKLNGDNVNAGVFLPKIYASSGFVLVGLDLDAAQAGMRVVESDQYTKFNASLYTDGSLNPSVVDKVGQSVFFSLSIGGTTSAYTHVYDEAQGIWNSSTMSGSTTKSVIDVHLSSDGSLSLNSQLLSYNLIGSKNIDGKEFFLGSTGDVGNVTIRLAEAVKVGAVYVPLNMINLTVKFHIDSSGDKHTYISSTVMLLRREETYSGSTTVSLPGDVIRTYTIFNASGVPEGVTLFADTSSSGYNGWLSSDYISRGLSLDDSTVNVIFGTAAAKTATIAVGYSGVCLENLEFTMNIGDSLGNTYSVHVFVKYVESVSINLFYSSVATDSGAGSLVPLKIDSTPAGMELSWNPGGEANSISIPYGESLESATSTFVIGGKQVVCSYYHAVELMIELIDPVLVSGERFVYSDHWVGLYLGTDMLYKYNTTSSITDSMTFYAHFGVTVKFSGGGVSLLKQSVVIAPGTSLHDNGFLNVAESSLPAGSTIENPIKICESDVSRPGYHFYNDIRSWCWALDDGTFRKFDFDSPIYTNHDLVLPWAIDRYVIVVEGGESPAEVYRSYGEYDYGSMFSLKFDNYVVTEVSGKYVLGEVEKSFIPSGTNTSEMSFTVPAANNGSTITVTLKLSEGHSVGIRFVGVTDLSNPLPSDSTLTVNAFGQTRSFTASGTEYMIVFDNVSDRSFSVTMSGDISGWYYSVSKVTDSGTATVTGGIGGRVSLGTVLSDMEVGNMTYVVAIYHFVSVSFTPPNAKERASFVAVDVDGNSSPDATVSATTMLFKGYSLTVKPIDGWALRNGVQTGTGSVVIDGGVGTYSILGTVDVSVEFVQKLVTVTIKIETSGVDDLSKMNGLKIDIVLNGSRYQNLTISSDSQSIQEITIPNVPESTKYDVSSTIDGFATSSVPAVDPAVTINATLLVYTVSYLDSDGSPFVGGIGVTRWTVLDTGTWADYRVDGREITIESAGSDGSMHQVWCWKNGDSFSGMTYEPLSTDMFRIVDRSLVLYALPVPTFEPSETELFFFMGVTSDFATGIELEQDAAIALDGFLSTITFEGSSLTIFVSDGVLKVESDADIGSGCIRVGDGFHRIVLIILPEAAWSSQIVSR